MATEVETKREHSQEEIRDDIRLYFDKQYPKRQERLASAYKSGYLNQAGKPTDANMYTTDFVSGLLKDHIADLMEIAPIEYVGKNYDRSKANETTLGGGLERNKDDGLYYPKNCASTRKEEYIAKFMNQKTYDEIGFIMGIQVPLKQTAKDSAGKIDMLAYNKESHTVSILELKKPDNGNPPSDYESMLRCVMEAFTYYKQLNLAELLKDFSITAKPVTFAISPLVYKGSKGGSRAYNDLANALVKEKEPPSPLLDFMRALSKELDADAKAHGFGGAGIRPLCYEAKKDETDYEVKKIKGWDVDV